MPAKIIFIGPMGAGKTTAIAAVSDVAPIATDVLNTDTAQCDKPTTTVAMDYGEIQLEDDMVALYGIPGQDRFDFMWSILAEGALGAVLLLNHERPQARQDLLDYLDAFPELSARGALVVAVGRAGATPGQALQPYREALGARQLALPVFAADVRRKTDVLLLIETLIANAEVNAWT
ncbi:ATP/GTP-binding protein [Pseudomonas sp. MAP12]|uniref:ATP/GTP-binding protein n=1 Tax=Geopseudomonas aromaticivorans TaxID=2849492 RepID=A0ABS6N0G9_9GAMM|nr:ATP/GTP-binding protein [Pseudomonas aromaticivorans]MBV2134544.1 ATP/GTP-binding protein [Pseudomonas aromaticivorans]